MWQLNSLTHGDAIMRKPILLTLIFALTFATGAETAPYPFQDPDLKIADRIDDLVFRMTLEEKVGQLRFDTAAIPRLGVPQYNWRGRPHEPQQESGCENSKQGIYGAIKKC